MIKKGIITQFDDLDVNIALGIADRFGFQGAYKDYAMSQDRKPSSETLALTWFMAGIIVGRENAFEAVRTIVTEKKAT